MEQKYKLTFLPLFEHELNHIVDYITYIFYNRRDLQTLLDA